MARGSLYGIFAVWRRVRALSLAVALLLLPLPMSAASEPPIDWAVATFTLPHDTMRMVLELSMIVHVSTAPVVVGFGHGGGPWSPFIAVQEAYDDGIALSSTSDAGGLDIMLLPMTPLQSEGRIRLIAARESRPFAAGSTVAILFFVPGATFSNVIPRGETAEGLIPAHLETGGGSRLLKIAGPDAAGPGATVAGRSLGVTRIQADMDTAIAGSLSFDCIGACHATWTAPDGRTQNWTQVGGLAVNLGASHRTYAGPAGQWQWSWEGTNDGAAFGALAPIGPAAAHFRSDRTTTLTEDATGMLGSARSLLPV